MNTKILGLVLLVGGAVLFYFGWQEKESFASSVSETVEGTPTDQSMWMLGGGAVAAVAGLAMLARGRKD